MTYNEKIARLISRGYITSKTDIQKKKFDINGLNAIAELLEGTTHIKSMPAVVILDFDQDIEPNDVRISIMEQYGWRPSFTNATTDALTKELVAKGWDLKTYNYNNAPTDAQLSEDSTSALNACKEYVRIGLQNQESKGFYNPICWGCKNMKYGPTLGKALEFYGYKIARGVLVGESGTWFSKDSMKPNFTQVPYYAIYTNNLPACKTQIQNAITNNGAINIFTHYVVNTASEDRGYDCTKTVYLELMDYIKDLENEGKVVVSNFLDFYTMCYPKEAFEVMKSRFQKGVS